jgi:hypothetical protein
MARKRESIIKPHPKADTACAVCGRPLTLFDNTTALDGRIVCAADCLGVGILRMRQHNADEPPQLPDLAYFDPAE